MEKNNNNMMGDAKKIIQELLQGLEMARQLQIHLHVPSTSQETRELLIQKIITAFEKALQMVNWKGPASVGETSSQHPSTVGIRIMSDESPTLSASPCSEDSDRDFKDHDQNASRKRKTLPRWTKQVRVNPGMGVEGPLDDGYSWRKYGQKDILGAMFPRGYYRCTHRNVQGCLATKQVQRSDEDQTIFEITYRGKHTCTVVASPSNNNNAVPHAATTATWPRENQESNFNANPQQQQQNNINDNVLQSFDQQPINDLLFHLREGLRVQTENLDSSDQLPLASLYNDLPSSSNIKTENNQVFLPSPLPTMLAENFNSSPSYVSPATSGISHISVSGNLNMASSAGGSQINDMISAATSASNSPTVGLNPDLFDQFEFDGHHFTFDNLRF